MALILSLSRSTGLSVVRFQLGIERGWGPWSATGRPTALKRVVAVGAVGASAGSGGSDFWDNCPQCRRKGSSQVCCCQTSCSHDEFSQMVRLERGVEKKIFKKLSVTQVQKF